MGVRQMVARARQHDTVVCRELCRAAGVRFRPPRHAHGQKSHGTYDGMRECFSQRYGVRL